MNKLEVYIDGSCFHNPGPGGFAAVFPIDGKIIASCGHVTEATNNQAELRGALQALKAIKKPCEVTMYTDSRYLITCWNHDDKWLTNENRSNHELWFEFIQQAKKGKHTIKFVKVPAHAGVKYNEIADRLAKAEAAKARHLLNER